MSSFGRGLRVTGVAGRRVSREPSRRKP
jgi:hypothetical protein